MIFRFLTGFAGSAFLSVAGGTVADLYRPHEFFIPMALYSASPMAGPELGPLYSGFVNYYDNNWQWAFWAITIWAAVMWLAIALFVPETFHPKILTLKARRLRKETGDESYRSKHEIDTAQKTIRQTLAVSMKRVPQLLALEPILFLLCLWSAILLGIIYMFFEAYPIVFEQQHGFTIWQTGLSFLGIFVGMIIALCTMPWFSAQYTKARHAHHGNAPPEARLPPAMAGSFLTVIGLFIFGESTALRKSACYSAGYFASPCTHTSVLDAQHSRATRTCHGSLQSSAASPSAQVLSSTSSPSSPSRLTRTDVSTFLFLETSALMTRLAECIPPFCLSLHQQPSRRRRWRATRSSARPSQPASRSSPTPCTTRSGRTAPRRCSRASTC